MIWRKRRRKKKKKRTRTRKRKQVTKVKRKRVKGRACSVVLLYNVSFFSSWQPLSRGSSVLGRRFLGSRSHRHSRRKGSSGSSRQRRGVKREKQQPDGSVVIKFNTFFYVSIEPYLFFSFSFGNEGGNTASERSSSAVATAAPAKPARKPPRGGNALSRTDSIRTQNSIQLLDENMTLIGTLRARGDRCR